MASLRLTVTESLRYRGRSGHYTWLVHRLTGLGILSFLLLHVIDTANAHYFPHIYAWSIDVFKHPLFGLGEVAILGCVLFHAFNGTRIALLDFRPEWWKHQVRTTQFVWALFLILFVPMAIFLLIGIVQHCGDLSAAGGSCWTFPLLSDYPAS